MTFQYSMFSLEGPAEYPVNGVTTSPSVHDLFTFNLRLHSRLVLQLFIFLVIMPTIPTAMLKFINYHLIFPREIQTKPLIFKSPSATRTFLIQPVYPRWALQCD